MTMTELQTTLAAALGHGGQLHATHYDGDWFVHAVRVEAVAVMERHESLETAILTAVAKLTGPDGAPARAAPLKEDDDE